MNSQQLLHRLKKEAQKVNISPQILLQNYMMERFLERLSKSDYKHNFILKGGLLIANLVGLDTRSTQDIDTTIINQPMDIEHIKAMIENIVKVSLDDHVIFELKKLEPIMEEAEYSGFRCSLIGIHDRMRVPFKIDISTGDTITPRAIDFSYKLMLTDHKIDILSYNLETILAEKLETILSRGVANTRARDYYDVFILWELFNDSININTLKDALYATSKQRKTEHYLDEHLEILTSIKNSIELKVHWENYQKTTHILRE